MPFTVLIDESGEAGIARVRKPGKRGASPYFVLGCCVLQPAGLVQARSVLTECREAIGKTSWGHATELDHSSKVFLGRQLAKLPMRSFAVISNKATLGKYKSTINEDPQKYYNKCLQYLLERVCQYLAQFNVSEEDVSVVLERRNHDYDAMLRFIGRVRENPLYEQSKSLRLLNPFSIIARGKNEEELLKIADFISHATYQLTNRNDANYHIPERRYFEEIAKTFAAAQNGSVLDTGIKCIHSLEALELDPDIRMLLEKVKAAPPRRA